MNGRRALFITLAALLAIVAIARRNGAQDANEVNVEFHTFQDTRSVTVLSPDVDLAKDFTDRTSIRANFGVDAITAASDSCARCHINGAPNRREGAGLSLTQKFSAFKGSFGASYSQERFYRATTVSTSLSRDLAEANTTVAAGYTFSLNQPTLHPTQQVMNQFQNDGFVSLTQTLTKTTIAQIGYEIERLSGYLDNPFLRTSVNGTMTLGQVPDTRFRQTATARLRQALPADMFLQLDYRRYSDDWSVHSNTFSAGLSRRFSPAVLASASYRRYDQTGAFFYAPSYVGTPQYFTGDFRLEPFNSGLYTGRFELTPSRSIFGLPTGSALTVQYDRYRADNGFQAAMMALGVRVPIGGKP